ncbi:MAG: OB-fold nucleic acid binding domain-containing protein [Nocardioides sp.]
MKGRIRTSLSRWANASEQNARDLREARDVSSDVAISDAPDREVVSLSGSIQTVTLRPRGGVPALEAELFDGTGSIVLVWLGRRRITGITPGRTVRAKGRIGRQDGFRVMFNPRYELMP